MRCTLPIYDCWRFAAWIKTIKKKTCFCFSSDTMRTLMPLCDPCQWFYYHWSTASALVVVVSNLHPERASGTSMAGEKSRRSAMDIKRLAGLLQRGAGRLLVIDSRTFSEYNASHVHGAVNVCCSKLVKRRLQQDKVSVTELLQPNGKVKVSSVCLRECVGSLRNREIGEIWVAFKSGWCLYADSCKPLKGSVNNAVSFVWTSQPCRFTIL